MERSLNIFTLSRCSVCFALWGPTSGAGRENLVRQSDHEINARLSIFNIQPTNYMADEDMTGGKDALNQYTQRNGYWESLKNGDRLEVGGRHERICHVARIEPKNFYRGYGQKLFYLIFIPITVFWAKNRRKKNPEASFFPIDKHRAGRIILTNVRLVLYIVNEYGYGYYSIPLRDIRELRQDGASLRIQPHDKKEKTIGVWVGDDLGEFLWAAHVLGRIPVQDPDQSWRRPEELER
jgi:hypothetical protein